MSRTASSIFILILILLLSAFFFFSPNIFGQKSGDGSEIFKEILVKRFTSLGNSIAHAAFVEDAIIMEEEANLNEIIARLLNDEPEITYVHFTDRNNNVLASSDSTILGKIYNSNLLASGNNTVRERNGVYEGGFSINIGKTAVGALYFGVQPKIPEINFAGMPNQIVLYVGVFVAFLAFFITLISGRALKTKLIEEINRKQEEVFSPRVTRLIKEEADAQTRLQEFNNKISDAKQDLQKISEDFEARKREIELNPVVQSIEKLKESEERLLKQLDQLKEEISRLNTEINLLTQKREDLRTALEAERKEERTLHEKLDLIKKKILHLETPRK